jgi:NADH:ubiquinone oxidoreductase subunit 6 (subunit J)
MNSVSQQTASTWGSGTIWLIVIFLGAFVLVAVMAWARAKNKAITPEEFRRTEQATHDLYKNGTTDETTRP